jgi:hypothetical protein
MLRFGNDSVRRIQDAMEMRYKLLPTLYTLFYIAHTKGNCWLYVGYMLGTCLVIFSYFLVMVRKLLVNFLHLK